MSGVVRWFKSGKAVLTKFKPLTEDAAEDEDDQEMVVLPTETKQQDDEELPGVFTVEDVVDKLGFGLFQVLLCLFSGSIWVVEAFEVMILSILSGALKCQWNLDYAQEATITMVVFFGFLVGSPIWGTVADRFGRKKALLTIQVLGFIFGIASAFSPNYYVMLLLRGLVGFTIGGGFLGPAYCAEFLPARTRAVILCLIQISWAVGSVMEALLALVVMTSIDHEPWRWLLGFSALPLLVVALVFPLVPESPRYLIYRGMEEKAKKVLATVAKVNCKSISVGRLVTEEEKERLLKERNQNSVPTEDVVESVAVETEIDSTTETTSNGTLPHARTIETTELTVVSSDNDSDSELLLDEDTQKQDTRRRTLSWSHGKKIVTIKLVSYYRWIQILFKNGWWKTTLLLWYLWFAANIIYYGGTLLTTSLFQHDEHCGLDSNDTNGTDGCKVLTKSDYIYIMWTTCAEFPGTLWIIVILLIVGRKKSMAITALLTTVCYGLLFLCLNQTALTLFLFGVRGFGSGFFQAIYLYTPEVYPTAVRAIGMALCSCVSRIGSMIAPYIAQTLLASNSIATISLFVIFSLLSALAALLLPIETKGRAMKDTGG
ncbi:putative transporter svop-1 [Dysidea avara]|uniref:putative transporter svop-1 n=1 Tax=Dysidea avara TaxID=196820 RepID=UPI00331A8EA5